MDRPEIWANASKQANRTEPGLRKLARKMLDDGRGHGDAAGLPARRAGGAESGPAGGGRAVHGRVPGRAPADGPGPAMIAVEVADLRHPLRGVGRHAPVTIPQVTGPEMASPVPAATLDTFRAPYAGESLTAAPPGSLPLPRPSPRFREARYSFARPDGRLSNDAAGCVSSDN
jgi:hypothetical protein